MEAGRAYSYLVYERVTRDWPDQVSNPAACRPDPSWKALFRSTSFIPGRHTSVSILKRGGGGDNGLFVFTLFVGMNCLTEAAILGAQKYSWLYVDGVLDSHI